MQAPSLARGLAILAGTLCAAPALACLPPLIIPLSPAPNGPEGQLPLVLPNIAQQPVGVIPPNPCPVPGRYGNDAPLPSLSDADYQRLFGGGTPLPAAWDVARVYNAGDTASVDGVGWRAKWWTQGERPGSGGAWEPLDNGTAGAWSNSIAYSGGAQVVYNGLVYRARWWTQGEVPGSQQWGAWELLPDVPPPSGLPQTFLANVYRILDATQATQRYDFFINTPIGPRTPAPARWEIHVNGEVAASDTLFHQVVTDCPEPKPGNPVCEARYAWTASATLPATRIDPTSRVSVWLCNAANVCRPTSQLWARFGTWF
ncbi:carbohydrate-binding protein [Chitiniphilus shinanonensis]|uniref:carbohydrate-binding protein n=1 Tax=Chitiniphilus shinanonensis TaxID=553088 RepID=UPI003022EEAF